MDALKQEKTSETIPTNMRLLLVMEEMARIGVPTTPTEINQILGLPKPTIHRLFATLEGEGFLQREVDGRSYSPGRRMRTLATGILSSLRVRTARLAVIGALAEEIGETCNLAIPDREAMIYLDRVETKWPLRFQLPIGSQVPFYCTASGKMYLSTLNEAHLKRYVGAAKLDGRAPKTITDRSHLLDEIARVREEGYAQDDEEFLEGMVALAVPVIESHGRMLSTLSFHAPIQRMKLEDAYRHLPRLHSAAKELSKLVDLDSE